MVSVDCNCGRSLPFNRACPECKDTAQGVRNILLAGAKEALDCCSSYWRATLLCTVMELDDDRYSTARAVGRLVLVYNDLAKVQAPGWRVLARYLDSVKELSSWGSVAPLA